MKNNKHIQKFNEHQENLNISDVSGSKKYDKCWVIRNSEGNVVWVHKTMNDELRKDCRKQGLYIEEHMLMD
jgi:hypothetical protein